MGVADAPYHELREELKQSLTEYYRVNDMHNYDELIRCLGFFTHRYGKINRLDSLNEYWLEFEARLRTDFNIPGLHVEDMPAIKKKSEMKKMFHKAGVATARGRLVTSYPQTLNFIREVGYPVIAKPDIGVGANQTYKIVNEPDLIRFFESKPPLVPYFIEEYIQGRIQTFDGLTDQNGNIVFFTSHQYNLGVMDAVNQNLDFFYYSMREIPEDLEIAGRKLVKVFNLRERFFHIEFFRAEDGRLVGLEVNMRPPGGLTTDMFNYANDIDIYAEWANIVVHNIFTSNYSRPYHCGYVGRKDHFHYSFNHDQIINRYPRQVIHHEPISGVFSPALGNYGYLVRSPNLEELIEIAHFIHQKE